MSIYFDFEVGPKGRMFRRAVERDKYDIELIWNREHSEGLFRDVDIGALIELSALSICMINENKEIMGFMALSDYPDVLGVDPADWENWIRNMYQRFYLSRNTLFIHFMCCIDSVNDFFLEEALQTVFLNDCYLLYILFIVPMFYPEEQITGHQTFKKRNIVKYSPKSHDSTGNYLYTALRAEFCPRLKMRRAVEEDNDDIVEILDKKCPRLKELYGEYYISEIIGRHPESNRKIIVADIQSRAVAVMCLNTDVNYEKLSRLYELGPYHGLKMATALEKELRKRSNSLLSSFGEPIMLGKWSPFDDATKVKHKEQQNTECHKKPKGLKKQRSRVNFEDLNDEFLDETVVKYHSADLSDQVVQFRPSYNVAHLLDEDPFDYDIVNIDATLLREDSDRFLRRPSLDKTSSYLVNPFRQPRQKKVASYTSLLYPKATRVNSQKQVKLDDKVSETFQGVKNAFRIELFAFREDIDERNAYDLLEAAFELMKDYDYCIITVPTVDKSFPLLQHFCFIPMKQKVCCDYSLYIAHRSSVLGKLRVREAEIIDIPEIARLMVNLSGKETMTTVETAIKHKENKAFVFTSGMYVVGLGILESPEEIDFIRGRFNVGLYQIHKYHVAAHGVDAGYMTLKMAIVYPVFEQHFRFFARELMRLSGQDALLWLTTYKSKWTIDKCNSIVASMAPLVPRTVDIDSDAIPELTRIREMTQKTMPFNCWFINRKMTSLPKADVNTRIVITGASRTALGFLNGLLFGETSSYLTFNNVTLVSRNGLPYKRHSNPIAESMHLKHYNDTDKYLKSVPYTYYVNVIHGTMKEIDLQEKYITLTSGSRYYYDLLFLFFGEQYQHPDYMVQLSRQDKEQTSPPKYTRLDDPKFSDTKIQIGDDDTPENVFVINDVADANRALKYVEQLMDEDDMKIIVYGATIEAYLCINALLEMKVPPENIVFVEPFPDEDPCKTRIPVFDNVYVDHTVLKIFETLKIKVYRSFYFRSWTVTVENVITHADFLSYAKYQSLECNALFYYEKKGVNMRAFIAILKSGLPHDGGIVIDHECRTLDPYVYAAGPCTHYKRYFGDTRCHKYYNSYELGGKLGAIIRDQLDPLFVEAKPTKLTQDCTKNENNSFKSDTSVNDAYVSPEMTLIPLTNPIVMYCVLPGGLKYLEVRSPGKKIPHNYVQSLRYNGYVFETFKAGYFKIHLTKDFVVDGITCLSREKFSLENFKYIYGRPATELNNVHLRYMAHKLDDFFEFFRSPWACFLYHDHVDVLFAMVKQLLPKGQSKGLTLKEALREAGTKLASDSSTFTMNRRMGIQANFEKSPHIEAVLDFVIDWLTRHDLLLPMYFQASQTAQFTYDLHNNPLMKKAKRNVARMLVENLSY